MTSLYTLLVLSLLYPLSPIPFLVPVLTSALRITALGVGRNSKPRRRIPRSVNGVSILPSPVPRDLSPVPRDLSPAPRDLSPVPLDPAPSPLVPPLVLSRSPSPCDSPFILPQPLTPNLSKPPTPQLPWDLSQSCPAPGPLVPLLGR